MISERGVSSAKLEAMADGCWSAKTGDESGLAYPRTLCFSVLTGGKVMSPRAMSLRRKLRAAKSLS
jgi:hypothetical protein